MSDIDLTSPEAKAAIKAAVEEATAPLIAKRDELLAEVKNLKKGRQIDPADVEKLENELEATKQQLTEANKAAKKSAGEAETATKRAEAAEGATTKLLADNALGDALAKAGITNAAHQRAVKAMFGSEVQIVVDGDNKVAKIGDKSVVDALTAWAGTDEGKHFVSAPDTSGGGAGHGNRGNSHGDAADITSNDATKRVAAIQARLDKNPDYQR